LEEPCPEPDDDPEEEPDDDPEEEPDDESVRDDAVGVPDAGACPDDRGLLLVATAVKTLMRRMTRTATIMPMMSPACESFLGGIPPPDP